MATHPRCSKGKNGIVADGRARSIAANKRLIVDGIEAKYAEALANAGFAGRIRIRLRMWLETRRELEKVAPKDGLYLTHQGAR